MHDDSTLPLARADAWLKSRRRAVCLVVLVLAALIRITVYVELQDSPVVTSYNYGEMDMSFFDKWAVKIATTDPAGREPYHPIHGWHRRVADAFLEMHPERIGGREPKSLTTQETFDITKELWNGWYKGNRFHQEPFYAYLIALLYKINGGPDARLVYALQLAGGVLLVLLLYLATRALFGDLVAVLTAAMAMWWGPLMHYEVTLLRTSFITTMGVVLLYVGQRVVSRRKRTGSRRLLVLFGFGALIGLATTLKSTFLLFSGGILVALFWPMRRNIRLVMLQGVSVVLGIILVLLPVWIRNIVVGAPTFSMTSVGPVTFAGANYPGYDASLGWYPYNQGKAIATALEQGEGTLTGAVTATVGLHDSIFGWFALLWEKFLLIWHWWEMPNNTSYYYSTLHSNVLAASEYLVTAGWILPAALVGLSLAVVRQRSAQLGIWLWYLVCAIGPMVVFYVLSRFRAPMVVAMMPFAAFGLVQTVGFCSRKRWVPAVVSVVAFGLLFAFMQRTLPRDPPLIGPGPHGMAVKDHYESRVNAAKARGDEAAALEAFEDLFATAPDYLFEIGPDRPIESLDEYGMVKVFGQMYGYYVQTLVEIGREADARPVAAMLGRFQQAIAVYDAKMQARQRAGKIP